MFNSIKLYARYFTTSLLSKSKRAYLKHDFYRYHNRKWYEAVEQVPEEKKRRALELAVSWLLHAQDRMDDDGFGCYHLVRGWLSSYPETSGYILPTLIQYEKQFGKPKIVDRVVASANWLLSLQKNNGGWQGGRIAENKPVIVFNSGQVIRGMLAVYELTGEQKYLDAAISAADWLSEIQHPDGFWKQYALMEQARVYDTYVDVPLLMVWKHTAREKYKNAAIRNLDWVIHNKQRENGWFEDCDNTVIRNAKPILHTIAYTLDGLFHAGIILNHKDYIEAALKPARALLQKFSRYGFLNGRYDENWTGSEYPITTSYAQMALVWLDMFAYTREKDFREAGSKINDQLVYLQTRAFKESVSTRGALPGSVPLWGRYEPFAYPNWATKYFADSLLKELHLNESS